jgi:citrate synthase
MIRTELRLDQFETLLTMVALTPIVIANSWRECEKLELIESRTDLKHVANFIWMLTGSLPPTQDLKDLETTVILHMDDPDNPSLSTLELEINAGASISKALGSALLIHGDPLHHGAGQRAMKMIEDIADPTMVKAKLLERLDSGRRIFGIGHRIYRTIDPRAVVLRNILKRRASGTKHERLYKLVEKVATVGPSLARERKGLTLHPNVDLYNAAVYTTLGIPAELNTALFAMARTAGWMAHILDWKAASGK